MLSVAIILFRESLEMAIIVGIIAASTKTMTSNKRWIFGGIALGALVSCLIGGFAKQITNFFSGYGQEILNSFILMAAILMICWTVVWMKQHAMKMTKDLKKLGNEVCAGNEALYSVMLIVALAVIREGTEIFVFLYGVITSFKIGLSDIIIGSVIGSIGGISLGAAIYFGISSIRPGYFFKVTGILLVLIAAGMSAELAGNLTSAGMIKDFTAPIWDLSEFLPLQSIFGRLLQGLIGYNDRPSFMQLFFYCGTIALIYVLLSSFGDGEAKVKKEALEAE